MSQIPTEGPAVLKFYSTTCPPCKKLSPITKQIAKENPEVSFIGIDIKESIETTKDYEVKSVPTLIFIKDGEEVNRLIGLKSKKEVEESVFLLLE